MGLRGTVSGEDRAAVSACYNETCLVHQNAEVVDQGVREVRVFYVGPYKLHFDPEEGSISCECEDHAAYVREMLTSQRCEHSGAVWRLLHPGGLLG